MRTETERRDAMDRSIRLDFDLHDFHCDKYYLPDNICERLSEVPVFDCMKVQNVEQLAEQFVARDTSALDDDILLRSS